MAHWQITFTACSARFQDICGSSQDTRNSVWLSLFAVAYSKGIQTASFLLFFLLHLFLIFNNFSHFCSFFWPFSDVYLFPKSHSARSCQLTKGMPFLPSPAVIFNNYWSIGKEYQLSHIKILTRICCYCFLTKTSFFQLPRLTEEQGDRKIIHHSFLPTTSPLYLTQ